MNNLSSISVFGRMSPILMILMLSDLILKGVALYKSAKKDQKIWFIALLIVNSLGILPILYLIINKDIVFFSTHSSKKITARKQQRK